MTFWKDTRAVIINGEYYGCGSVINDFSPKRHKAQLQGGDLST